MLRSPHRNHAKSLSFHYHSVSIEKIVNNTRKVDCTKNQPKGRLTQVPKGRAAEMVALQFREVQKSAGGRLRTF
jgi:hypothetical protein